MCNMLAESVFDGIKDYHPYLFGFLVLLEVEAHLCKHFSLPF